MSVTSTWRRSEGANLPIPAPKAPAPEPPRLAGVMLAAVGLAVVLAVAWWVTNSSVFDARSLLIRGNAALSRTDVARLAGVGNGTNVLWLRPSTVERRLERSPWIASARVARTLPSTLSITIVERRAVALVAASRGRYLVSADGVVLARPRRGTVLPLIRVRGTGVVPGARLGRDAPALVVVRSFPPGLDGQVKEASVHGGIVDLELRSGVGVIFGDQSQAPEKAAALVAVLAWADRNDVQPAYIDVRAPAAPALRPEGAAVITPGTGPAGAGKPGPAPSPAVTPPTSLGP